MKTIAKIVAILLGAIIFITPATTYAQTAKHRVTTKAHTTTKPITKFGTVYGYQPYVIVGQTIYNPKKNYFDFIR